MKIKVTLDNKVSSVRQYKDYELCAVEVDKEVKSIKFCLLASINRESLKFKCSDIVYTIMTGCDSDFPLFVGDCTLRELEDKDSELLLKSLYFTCVEGSRGKLFDLVIDGECYIRVVCRGIEIEG